MDSGDGGIITMSNMSNPDEPRLFDCIWLIKPIFESTIRTHISVRIEMFSDLGKLIFFSNGIAVDIYLFGEISMTSS